MNDIHVLQTPDTFTLYKYKITNNFRHQKCEESTCLSSNSIELPFHKVKDIESNKNYTSVHHEKYNGLKK